MTTLEEHPFVRIIADVRVPIARIRLVRYVAREPLDLSGRRSDYRLDFSLAPRLPDARACFLDRWSPLRFEPLGQLFLLPPGEAVQSKSGSGMQSSVVIEYDRDAVAAWFGHEGWSDAYWSASLDIRSASARGTLLRLGEELLNPGIGGDALCEVLAAQAAIDIARHCAERRDAPPSGGLAPWRLRIIDDRLREGGAPPLLSELAALCSVSVRHLTRGYRATRGCSIGKAIAEAQLDHARRLLERGAGVTDVAGLVGFGSPSNFSTAFRRATGETPRAYRHRMTCRRVGLALTS